MRILVTNDDGIESAGIVLLADALRELGNVTIVAPDGDRSGTSHTLSFRDPVRVTPVRANTYACSGTPADCVVLGAYELCGGFPDLLVSGINRGANLGDDLSYSGTVAAAVEGTVIGIPSIAVSLAAKWPDVAPIHHWDTACVLALQLAREWQSKLGPTTFINLNVPNRPTNELAGVRYTRQGRKRYEDRLDHRRDEDGSAYFAIWGKFDLNQAGTGTDLEAVRDGYASITPVSIDRTDYAILEEMQRDRRLAEERVAR